MFVCFVAGLLHCYELPVQTDRGGKPIDRFLMSRSRSYQQTLTALIHEVWLNLSFLWMLHILTAEKLTLLLYIFWCVGEHSAVWMAQSSPLTPVLEGFHEPNFPRCLTGLGIWQSDLFFLKILSVLNGAIKGSKTKYIKKTDFSHFNRYWIQQIKNSMVCFMQHFLQTFYQFMYCSLDTLEIVTKLWHKTRNTRLIKWKLLDRLV